MIAGPIASLRLFPPLLHVAVGGTLARSSHASSAAGAHDGEQAYVDRIIYTATHWCLVD